MVRSGARGASGRSGLPRRLHITWLVEEAGALERLPYFAGALSREWHAAGHSVDVVPSPGGSPRGDVAIVHTDETRVSPACLDDARRYRRCVNLGARDVSKRTVSRQLLGRDDAWAGPVIVKTDLNVGGGPERRRAARRSRAARLGQRLADFLPWTVSGVLASRRYPIFEHRDRVPPLVWRNPRLVVERFLPERDGDDYCLRTWLFFGDAELAWISRSKRPVIKAGTARETVPCELPGDDLRALRKALGFDYGKFDYAVVDGRAVLYDATRTPTANPHHLEGGSATAAAIALGILGFAS